MRPREKLASHHNGVNIIRLSTFLLVAEITECEENIVSLVALYKRSKSREVRTSSCRAHTNGNSTKLRADC